MTQASPVQHLHIGRITVEAEPGADRHALQRALQQQLPAAIAARLVPGAAPQEGPPAVQHIADAVARRVTPPVSGEGPR
jgi:hypothetical protein